MYGQVNDNAVIFRLPGPSKASQEGTKNLPQRSSKSAKTQGETPPLQYKLKDISKGERLGANSPYVYLQIFPIDG